CELARERKAEARPAEALRRGGVCLAEFLEQFGLLLRSHANAGVGDGELDEVAAAAQLARRKLHLPRFGEFAGIAQKVEQDLPQRHGVTGKGAEVFWGMDDDAVPVRPGKLSGGADALVDQRC